MIREFNRNKARKKRHIRVRAKVNGTPEKPRLCVFRSNSNIYAQIIDDIACKTLVSASSLDKSIETASKGGKEAAKEVGKLIGQKAIDAGIKNVVFDRGGYLYHGRIKELADGARESGLVF